MTTHSHPIHRSTRKEKGMCAVLVLALLTTMFSNGCSEATNSSSKTMEDQDSSVSEPVLEKILTVLQSGDSESASRLFLEADWNDRPLFHKGSAMNLTESGYAALSEADRQAKIKEAASMTIDLKELWKTMVQAGLEAVGRNDFEGARQYFSALSQCGEALATDSPKAFAVVKLGNAMKKQADAELRKINQ